MGIVCDVHSEITQLSIPHPSSIQCKVWHIEIDPLLACWFCFILYYLVKFFFVFEYMTILYALLVLVTMLVATNTTLYNLTIIIHWTVCNIWLASRVIPDNFHLPTSYLATYSLYPARCVELCRICLSLFVVIR